MPHFGERILSSFSTAEAVVAAEEGMAEGGPVAVAVPVVAVDIVAVAARAVVGRAGADVPAEAVRVVGARAVVAETPARA